MMDAKKEPGPTVQFTDKADGLVAKPCHSKPKMVAAFGAITVVLLLSIVVSLSVYFSLKNTIQRPSLAELNLEEGERLTYQLDHDIEVEGGNVQNGSVRLIVGILVHNKSLEEYWFLIKFNLSYVGGDVEIRSINTSTEYFLVRLPAISRKSSNKSTHSFEVYGHRQTNTDLLRLVYGTLEQLFPTLKRELYESVDGLSSTGSKSLYPEDSPLLPGSVKMHREANTSDEGILLIKNHFDRNDFADRLSDIDLDLNYTDIALINKSNGMLSESHLHFSKQLNFGEQINKNASFNVTHMKMTLTSHATLVETIFLEHKEGKMISFHSFVKLVIPKSNVTFAIHENPEGLQLNASRVFFTHPSPGQQHNFTGNSSSRTRRTANYVPWKEADPLQLSVLQSFTLFEKKFIGIDVKGEGMVWLEPEDGDAMEIGVSFSLSVGGKDLGNIFKERYKKNHLEDGKDWRIELHKLPIKLTISVPVYILHLGVDFDLAFSLDNQISFPPEGNSINPVQLAVEVEPSCEVTVNIEAYLSVLEIRAGAYGNGTLVRTGLPVALSYQEGRSPGKKWCMELSARLTALELSAGIFYQLRHWWHGWGERHTLYEFGKWSAYNRNWELWEKCG